ncbi:unnamed protein product, partial [Brassica oleracea var. botrytis]
MKSLLSSSNNHLGLIITTGFMAKPSVDILTSSSCDLSGAMKTATSADLRALAESFDCRFHERRVWPEEEKLDDVGASSRGGHVAKDGNASCEREEGESLSRIGISRRNRGCLSFLSFGEASLGVVKGFDETRRETSLG